MCVPPIQPSDIKVHTRHTYEYIHARPRSCWLCFSIPLGQVPDLSFTVADVARIVGEDKPIRPIHVGEQANIDQVWGICVTLALAPETVESRKPWREFC